MQYIQALPTLITVAALAFMGFLVIRNGRELINKLFLAFLLTDSLWLLGVFLVTHASVNSSSPYFGRGVYAAALVLAIAVQAFSSALLKLKQSKLYFLFLYGVGAFLVPITLFTSKVVRDVKVVGGFPYPEYGSLYAVYLAYIIISASVFMLLLLYRWQSLKAKRDTDTKRQLDIVASGLIIFALVSLLTNLILPAVFTNAWPSQFAPVGGFVLAVAFFIAISRYRLFDIRTAVVRSTTYLCLVGLLALLFVFTANTAGTLVTAFRDNPNLQQLFNAILALAIAVSFQPLKTFFDRMTNRFFFRDSYETKDVVDSLNTILISNVDMHKMIGLCEALLADKLKLEYVYIGVYADKEKQRVVSSQHSSGIHHHAQVREDLFSLPEKVVSLRNLPAQGHVLNTFFASKNVSAIGKMISHDDVVGFIVFGGKKNGLPLTNQDLDVLSIASDQVAIAAQNILRFAQIENFTKTLKEKVDDATRKLRHANDKLRKLNETKDDFISMASHQLRTPLTSVKGYVSMVLDGDAGKITNLQRRLLNQSFVSSQRMVYLISDLLNVSRLKTGKFIIEPMPCNLAKVIQEEVDQLLESAKSRHLTMTYDRPEHFPVLMLDETKLRQVIMNFLDNAVYYTPADGHIEVRLVDKPKSIEFTVTDDGIGVPRHEQHHLFSKFFRAPNAKRARPDGTGLGLFMAKKVIIAQGGAVIFKSQEGKGSTFGFTFAKERLLPENFKMPANSEQTNDENNT